MKRKTRRDRGRARKYWNKTFGCSRGEVFIALHKFLDSFEKAIVALNHYHEQKKWRDRGRARETKSTRVR